MVRVAGVWTESSWVWPSRSSRLRARSTPDGEFGAVGEVWVEEDDPEAERLRAQGHRRADAAKADDAEGGAAEAADGRVADDEPDGVGRALRLVVQEQPPGQGHGQGDGVVGDFRGAVVRDVADQDAAPGRRLAVDAVVADAHADDGAESGEAGEVGGGDPEAEDHQPLGGGAVLIGQVRERPGVAHEHGRARAEDAALLRLVGIHPFGVQHRWHAFPRCRWEGDAARRAGLAQPGGAMQADGSKREARQ